MEECFSMSFLTLRDGVWHYQRRVPKDVRKLFGASRWRQSLRTQDRRVAEKAARELATKHDEMIAAKRKLVEMTPAERAVTEFEETTKKIANRRQSLDDRHGIRRMLAEHDPSLLDRREVLEEKTSAFIDGHQRRLDKATRAAVLKIQAVIAEEAKSALPLAPRGTQQKVIQHGGVDQLIAGARADQFEAAFAAAEAHLLLTEPRDEGEPQIDPDTIEDEVALLRNREKRAIRRKAEKDSLLTFLVPAMSPDAKEPSDTTDGPTLQAVFQHWCVKSGTGADRQRKVKVYVRRFKELFGDLPAKKITKQQVRNFAEALAQTPDIGHLPVKERNKDLKALIAVAQQRPNVPRLRKGTIARHIEGLAGLLGWAEGQEIIPSNPARGVKPPAYAAKPINVRPFKPEEIRRLLQFIDQSWGGSDRKNRDRWWVVQIAAWSGARLAEICQLRKKDIRYERGFWIFDINKDNGRKVKNEASIRCIPVHPRLIEMGLVKHAQSSPGEGVFPTFCPPNLGQEITDSFAYLMNKYGMTDPQLNFHSLRHSFQDACREAGVPADVSDALMGHARGNRHSRAYGDGYSLAVLASHLSRVDPIDQGN